MNNDIWYSYHNVLSRNAILNFIIGERGVGKSYGIKKYVIKRFLKYGKQFIYLRRYATELDESIKDNEFFKDICKDECLKGHTYKIRGDKIYIDDKICGYAIPLTKASIYKSVPFPYVETIIFDEFLIDNTTYRYLKDEPEKVLDLYETVSRLRENVRIFFLGNSISIVNPYFDYFNISMPYNSDIKVFKEGLILVNYIMNEKYRKVKEQSKFGKLIKDTKYGDYAINNQFLKDNNNFIRKKSTSSKFFFNIKVNGHIYGVWLDYNTPDMYISKSFNLNHKLLLTFDFNDHSENTILIKSRSVYFQNLINHYEKGYLFFENQNIKSDITNIIHKARR